MSEFSFEYGMQRRNDRIRIAFLVGRWPIVSRVLQCVLQRLMINDIILAFTIRVVGDLFTVFNGEGLISYIPYSSTNI